MELAKDWLLHDPGATDFRDAYFRHLAAVTAKLELMLVDHRVFGPLMKSMTAEQRAASDADSRARLEKAFAGDWEQYLATTRRDGAMYAALGITYGDWYDIISAWSRELVPRMVADLAATPDRLSAALVTLHLFLDSAMSAIGEAYIAASNAIASERQRETAAQQARGDELEAQNRRVEEASRLKSEFLANMSHELRTPLNSILGFSELLHLGEVGPLTDEQREFVGDIHASGKHLLRLINDILDLAKIEAGKLELHPEATDLGALLHEIQGVLRGVAREKSVTVEIDHDSTVSAVQLDPARLKQVLYNYLSNAIKFSSTGGRVHLTVRPEGAAYFRVEVRDEGAGISPEDQARLFVEFEQLDAGRSKVHAGTGLGLALTKRIVEAQGGTVGVSSVLGQGSTFFAVLPRRVDGRASLPRPRHVDGATPDAPRVLVVEDDAADQERLLTALVGAGYAVDTAVTCAQALRAISERAYDAITLDLLLPDRSGLDVLAALRQGGPSMRAPVIVVSLVTDSVTAGFVVHDVIEKPLDSKTLLASLASAGVASPTSGPILVVDDDEQSARLAAAALAQLGFRAEIASDGEAALAQAQRERPAAVVLDLVMPKVDGFAFLERFRANPAWADIPVLIWTVKDLDGAEAAALLRHAEAVLPKDGSGARVLVERLRAHLPRSRPAP